MSLPILKPLQKMVSTQLQIAASRNLCPQRLISSAVNRLVIPTQDISSINGARRDFRRLGNYAKMSSRRVHVNTLSIPGNKELGCMTTEDIEKRIKHLLNLTTEAKLCIQDCDESTETDFEEEFESAKNAVDSACIAFSELLEELALTDEGVPLLNEIRKMYAPSVEDLRAELKSLARMKAI